MVDAEIVEIGSRFKPTIFPLNSKSQAPTLVNGNARLYISLTCPYAQRVWIARNFKGLESSMDLIPINIGDKPSWYIERISSYGKVPALEHNGRVKLESLDILQYMDENFTGPKLFPSGSSKREAIGELLKNTEVMNQNVFGALQCKTLSNSQLERIAGRAFEFLEHSLGKFNAEGPYFLGSISGVDFAYVPFIERFNVLFQEIFKYNILEKQPRLSRWFLAINELEFYTSTKANPRVIINDMKRNLEMGLRFSSWS